MNIQERAEQTLGYLHPEEGPVLAEWAGRAPGPLVEIGSFAGKSTLWILSNAQHPVISIDHHRGNPEMQKGRECFVPEAWDEVAQRVDSLPLIRRTMDHPDIAPKVSLIAAPSLQVAEWWTTPIGFLFIDGDHSGAVRDDWEAWSPHLMPGAVLALHDTAIPAIAETVASVVAAGWSEQVVVRDSLRVFTR